MSLQLFLQCTPDGCHFLATAQQLQLEVPHNYVVLQKLIGVKSSGINAFPGLILNPLNDHHISWMSEKPIALRLKKNTYADLASFFWTKYAQSVAKAMIKV